MAQGAPDAPRPDVWRANPPQTLALAGAPSCEVAAQAGAAGARCALRSARAPTARSMRAGRHWAGAPRLVGPPRMRTLRECTGTRALRTLPAARPPWRPSRTRAAARPLRGGKLRAAPPAAGTRTAASVRRARLTAGALYGPSQPAQRLEGQPRVPARGCRPPARRRYDRPRPRSTRSRARCRGKRSARTRPGPCTRTAPRPRRPCLAASQGAARKPRGASPQTRVAGSRARYWLSARRRASN